MPSRRLKISALPGPVLAALLAFPLAALAGQGPGPLNIVPESSDYPLPKNDPNGLWKPTPDAFWAVPTAAAPDPSAPPPDLTPSQRQKWYDKAALVGTVLGPVPEGVLVRCAFDATPPSLDEARPDVPPRWNGAPRVYGTFVLKNYSHADTLRPGDTVKAVAFPAGRHKDADGTLLRIYDAEIRDF